MINLFQGENALITVSVSDEENQPADLTGATAILAYGRIGSGAVFKQCTIAGSTVSFEFTPALTSLMEGQYTCEIKIKTANTKIRTVYKEDLNVVKSVIPSFDEALNSI